MDVDVIASRRGDDLLQQFGFHRDAIVAVLAGDLNRGNRLAVASGTAFVDVGHGRFFGFLDPQGEAEITGLVVAIGLEAANAIRVAASRLGCATERGDKRYWLGHGWSGRASDKSNHSGN